MSIPLAWPGIAPLTSLLCAVSAQDKNGGITLAKDYGYVGSETPCHRSRYKAQRIKLAGYRKVSRGSEQDLKDALSQRPVAVGIDAHHPAFKLYQSGVFDIDYCTSHLTHAVLLVGYGTSKDGKAYWKLQNRCTRPLPPRSEPISHLCRPCQLGHKLGPERIWQDFTGKEHVCSE
jgi:hypothetical protein